MKKKMFGNDIIPNCNYCKNFIVTPEESYCEYSKTIKKDKCRKFEYNPLLRVPQTAPAMMTFSKEDFEIWGTYGKLFL